MVPNMAELPATFSDPQCVWAESERAWPEPQAEIMHPYLPCPGGTQCKARLSLWPVTVLARVIHSRVSKASDAALIQDTPRRSKTHADEGTGRDHPKSNFEMLARSYAAGPALLSPQGTR